MNDIEIEKLHEKLDDYVKEQNKEWKSFVYAKDNGFYQGFEEIGIKGCRSTEKRFKNYEIEKYLSNNSRVLDIGCNCGFFTIFTSRFVKEAVGVEINPYLLKIANETKDFLNVKNTKFIESSFEDFIPEKKFEIIFSLANDETIDGNTKFTFLEYISKVNDILADKGILIFETMAQDTFEPKLFFPKLEILKKKFTILDDKMIESEYPINVKQRRVLILKK
tara:strand:- start:151 stop:813 length:663 start_codon:yes stop_codon:yes gene_type:complete